MAIRAVIWDLGGVILRTDDRQPRRQLAERLGMTYEELESLVFGSPSAEQATTGEIEVARHWESVCEALKLPLEEIPTFQSGFWGGDQVDYELVDYIRALRPRYQTALLSNAWSDLRGYLENRWHIVDAFDTVIISAEVGLKKPDPRIYQIALQRLQAAPTEAVFIDDFNENVEGARAAGLHAIHFKKPAQARAELERLIEAENGTHRAHAG